MYPVRALVITALMTTALSSNAAVSGSIYQDMLLAEARHEALGCSAAFLALNGDSDLAVSLATGLLYDTTEPVLTGDHVSDRLALTRGLLEAAAIKAQDMALHFIDDPAARGQATDLQQECILSLLHQ